MPTQDAQPGPAFPSPAFASTGPHGHRARMRTRLAAAPAALADYEIIEMLLFLGIPRRDTKPAAKALINRFGSLAATFAAPPGALAGAVTPPRIAELFALVVESATVLARAEQHERVALCDWDALDRFLTAPSRRPVGLSALLLNNRNQLLAECPLPDDGPADATRVFLRHALERHATAAFLLRNTPAATPAVTRADQMLLAHAHRAAAALSVLVHDMVVTGQGDWIGVGRHD